MEKKVNVSSDRLVSLDVMRGLIMVLLAGESCAVWESLKEMHLGKVGDAVVNQFFHHRWHGLHLWDMVQPAFMLMAGTAMYLSYQSKLKRGVSWSQNFKHIAVRALKLFLLGTGLHCIYAGKLVFELWNVLTQLSFTTLIAYLIINRSFWFQIGFTIFLLILTEVLYRAILMPGFNQPFIEFHNFGAYMDTILMGKINPDGWVAINIIPTAAHTIWGVLVGKMLTSPFTSKQKILYLIIAGTVCLMAGFGLDAANITPIIKRISTSSFVLASAGWVLLFMAVLYWVIDVKQLNKHAWIFTAVGMNAIFLYLFFETVGAQWFNGAVGIFVKGGLSLLNVSTTMAALVSAMVTLVAEWGICYWLSRNRIFIKI